MQRHVAAQVSTVEVIALSTKVAVVIPVYRELNELEKISLAQCRKVLGRYPLIFVAPEGKNFSFFERGDMVVHFSAKHFQGVKSYSNLLLSSLFYETFRDFEYILIYQLDAFVFYDALEEFCRLGYDYIGAPWPLVFRAKYRKMISPVGNGGFSLRNVAAHYNLLLTYSDLIDKWLKKFPEDWFFSFCGKRESCGFNVAPLNVAYKFSAEFNPARVVKKNGGKLPFGCHGWYTHNPEFYTEILRHFGYVLNPIKELPPDSDGGLKNWLTKMSTDRLTRRIERGQSLLRYLPTKKFASIRVIRSPEAVKILSQLLTEDNSLADEIFIYDAEPWTNLLDDVPRADLPHLIISAENDMSLIATLKNAWGGGIECVISFRQEYLKRCEELFHRLGK